VKARYNDTSAISITRSSKYCSPCKQVKSLRYDGYSVKTAIRKDEFLYFIGSVDSVAIFSISNAFLAIALQNVR
jgi:hypothetical protein